MIIISLQLYGCKKNGKKELVSDDSEGINHTYMILNFNSNVLFLILYIHEYDLLYFKI